MQCCGSGSGIMFIYGGSLVECDHGPSDEHVEGDLGWHPARQEHQFTCTINKHIYGVNMVPAPAWKIVQSMQLEQYLYCILYRYFILYRHMANKWLAEEMFKTREMGGCRNGKEFKKSYNLSLRNKSCWIKETSLIFFTNMKVIRYLYLPVTAVEREIRQ